MSAGSKRIKTVAVVVFASVFFGFVVSFVYPQLTKSQCVPTAEVSSHVIGNSNPSVVVLEQ